MQCIVNPAIMLSPLDTQEAISSSKIEEILNYREAIFFGEKRVAEGSIELELVLELHKILMSSVRGEGKSPGQWRKNQNWIGPYGCTIENAKFVPPARPNALSGEKDWNGWINFYLHAVIEQSKENILKARSIMDFYERMKERLREVTHSQYSIQLLDALFNNSIFTVNHLARNIPKSTAHQLVRLLRERKMITLFVKGYGRRSSLLCISGTDQDCQSSTLGAYS